MYKLLAASLLAAPALGALPTCAEYCTSINQVCNMTNAQFTGPGVSPAMADLFCQALCPAYPLGTEADRAVDSFGCRAYHLEAAKNYSDAGDMANVMYHCPHAGFYGGGVCGTPQDFQCDFMMANCAMGGTHDACTSAYNMYSRVVTDTANMTFTKSLIKVTGATLQCRTANAFNVLVPGADQAARTLACTQAQPVSSACAIDCDDYCMLEGDVCGFGSTGNNQFADSATCKAACMTWQKLPPNTTQTSPSLTSGDSADCRWYHLNVASTDGASATTHCPHTKNYPTEACMPSCSNYCATIQSACMGSLMQFADNTACMAACANYTVQAAGYARPAATGNNLECRSYHAFVASTNMGAAMTHCVHAGAMSTCDTCGDTTAMACMSSSSSTGGSSSSSGNSASSLAAGAATAFLVLVGAVSAVFGL